MFHTVPHKDRTLCALVSAGQNSSTNLDNRRSPLARPLYLINVGMQTNVCRGTTDERNANLSSSVWILWREGEREPKTPTELVKCELERQQ